MKQKKSILQLEKKHKQGYLRYPVKENEFDLYGRTGNIKDDRVRLPECLS